MLLFDCLFRLQLLQSRFRSCLELAFLFHGRMVMYHAQFVCLFCRVCGLLALTRSLAGCILKRTGFSSFFLSFYFYFLRRSFLLFVGQVRDDVMSAIDT